MFISFIAAKLAHRSEQRDGLGLSLQLDAVALLELDVGMAQPLLGRCRDQDRVIGLARRRLDARGDVDGVADDAELEPSSAADIARDDRAGVDPDADPKLIAELLLDG